MLCKSVLRSVTLNVRQNLPLDRLRGREMGEEEEKAKGQKQRERGEGKEAKRRTPAKIDDEEY